MKIGIIGAGAMGSLYGAKLSALDENEVILIDISKEQIDAVNQNGLEMEENGRTIRYGRLRGVTDPKEAGICDLVVIFVKSTLTKKAVEGNSAVFGPETTVVTLQNGLGNIESISEVLGSGNILAGTTAHGASQTGFGKIIHAGTGKTIIGEPVKTGSEKPEQIRAVFEKAGLETEVSDNVQGLIWDKLLVNTGINALASLAGVTNGELLKHEELTAIMEEAVREGERVAKAKGIPLNFIDPVAHTKAVCEATSANRCSMLQDISNHRMTEIATINGAIVREAAKLGIAAPVNETLTRLILFRQK
jgi:2-dehydropantoate 2-reductase